MKKLLAVLTLVFTLALAAHAQEQVSKMTGCWYETRTPVGKRTDAGEIRIFLYDDGTAYAERDFNDEAFDDCFGTFTVRTNRLGRVLSVTIRFTSDFAGESFTLVMRSNVGVGAFRGGGYAGAIRVKEVE